MNRVEWIKLVENYIETHEDLKKDLDFRVDFREGTTCSEATGTWRTEAEDEDHYFVFVSSMTGEVRFLSSGSKI